MRSTYVVFTQIKSYFLYIVRKPKIYNRFNKKEIFTNYDILILKLQPIRNTRMDG